MSRGDVCCTQEHDGDDPFYIREFHISMRIRFYVTVFELELYLSYISNDNAVFPWLILRIMPFFLALNFVDF